MDLLEYLRQRDEAGVSKQDDREVEYRLLCSGTLFRGGVLGDWSRSDVARILLDAPLKLFVSSHRITDNPQELSVRLRIGPERLVSGKDQLIHYPDDQVVEDFASFLTAALRRLVTVIGKTRTVLLERDPSIFPSDLPSPIFKLSARHWEPRGVSVLYGHDSVEVRENDPPPVAVSPERIAGQLHALAQADAQDVLRAVRLYVTALELVPERPEVAYLLLVSAVETLAGEYLKRWIPPEAERVEHQKAVAKQAIKFGLPEDQARALALTASKREHWILRKFVKFVTERVGGEIWTEDEVFPLGGLWQPDHAKLSDYLRAIYRLRSDAVHEGRGLPPGVTIGTSHLIDARVAHEVLAGALEGLPPIVWFERAVNICLRSRIDEIEREVKPPS